MSAKKAAIDFEKALNELTALVEKLEKSNISLEDSLKAFEEGVKLTRQCQTALQEAEQKVKLLVGDPDDDHLIPFETEDK